MPGAVRNADRMNQRHEGSLWAFPGVCTPQNRTYQVWVDFNNFKLQNGICQEILLLRFRFLLKKIGFQ